MGPASQRLYHLSNILPGAKPLTFGGFIQATVGTQSPNGVHFLCLSRALLCGCSFSILVVMNLVLQDGIQSVHWPCHCEAACMSSVTERCNLTKLSLTNWASLEATVAMGGTCESSS